jgi:hypothetical protein
MIADERGEINIRSICLLTKTCAGYPLQSLLPRACSSQTLAGTSRVVPHTSFRTALGGEDVFA